MGQLDPQMPGRCRIVKLQKSIVAHTPSVLAAIEHGLFNGRTESVNTKVRVITRIRFKSPDTLIAWPCSASAATDPPYPAANDPRKQQKSALSIRGFRCSATRRGRWPGRPALGAGAGGGCAGTGEVRVQLTVDGSRPGARRPLAHSSSVASLRPPASGLRPPACARLPTEC